MFYRHLNVTLRYIFPLNKFRRMYEFVIICVWLKHWQPLKWKTGITYGCERKWKGISGETTNGRWILLSSHSFLFVSLPTLIFGSYLPFFCYLSNRLFWLYTFSLFARFWHFTHFLILFQIFFSNIYFKYISNYFHLPFPIFSKFHLCSFVST